MDIREMNWKGKPVIEMDKEELYEIIKWYYIKYQELIDEKTLRNTLYSRNVGRKERTII